MARSWILLFAVVLATATCGGRSEVRREALSQPVTVRIVNRNWADMRVYLERDGARALLGVVTSGTTVTFPAPLDIAAPGATLRLVGDPIGSTTAFASESFQVAAGQTVEWTIRVPPQQSGITVR